MSKLYLQYIEGQENIGVIVSPVDIDEFSGEEIDSETLIIWRYMGDLVPNKDPVKTQIFINWVRNILVKAGNIVVMPE